MRRSRFTEDQIIGVLREYEADVKTAELCRKHERDHLFWIAFAVGYVLEQRKNPATSPTGKSASANPTG